jgi:hypothetical protein
MSCQREALRMKMMSEGEVIVLKQELEVTQRAMTQCQTEYNRTKRLLTKQVASYILTLTHSHAVLSSTLQITSGMNLHIFFSFYIIVNSVIFSVIADFNNQI